MRPLLCDIGGVLLNVDFETVLHRLGQSSGISREELKERIFSSGAKEQHDSGEIGPHEFYLRIIRNGEITFGDFRLLWGDIFTENREMVEYIRLLARSSRLFIASNTDPIHYEYFMSRYPWFSFFHGLGLSFRLKSIKPSPEFFLRLCREFGISCRDALFVDDLQVNIDAASRLGIRSHLFRDVAGFRLFMEDTAGR